MKIRKLTSVSKHSPKWALCTMRTKMSNKSETNADSVSASHFGNAIASSLHHIQSSITIATHWRSRVNLTGNWKTGPKRATRQLLMQQRAVGGYDAAISESDMTLCQKYDSVSWWVFPWGKILLNFILIQTEMTEPWAFLKHRPTRRTRWVTIWDQFLIQ